MRLFLKVAELKDGKYQLQDGLISELEVSKADTCRRPYDNPGIFLKIETWPFYTEQEKQLMRRSGKSLVH